MKDFYNVEKFVQRWMICTMLNDLCHTLNGMYFVEIFELRWVICTLLNDLLYVERLALRWMICTGIKDLYHRNIGVVSSSLLLKIENKYPDFVYLLD